MIDYTNLTKICIDNNTMYSFSRECNLLFVIDYETMRLFDLGILPEEDYLEKNLISEIVKWQDKLVFIPRNAKNIYVKEHDQYRIIDIGNYVDRDLKNKFDSSLIYDDVLYLFGHWSSMIIGIDLTSEKIIYTYNIPDEYVIKKENRKDAFFSHYYFESSIVYLPFLSAPYIALFYVNEKKVEWIKVCDLEIGFSSIIKSYNGKFILPCRGLGMIVYDEGNKRIEYLFTKEDFFGSLELYSYRGKIYIPRFANSLVSMDFNDYEIEKYDNKKCSGLIRYNNENYLILDNVIEIYGNEGINHFRLDFSNLEQLLRKYSKSIRTKIENVVYENSYFKLQNYLDNLF